MLVAHDTPTKGVGLVVWAVGIDGTRCVLHTALDAMNDTTKKCEHE
jgi:hypothetical protein